MCIEGKGLNTLYPGSVYSSKEGLDPFRKLTGNIAVGHEAFRADVPAHYDANYMNLSQDIQTGKDRMRSETGIVEGIIEGRKVKLGAEFADMVTEREKHGAEFAAKFANGHRAEEIAI